MYHMFGRGWDMWPGFFGIGWLVNLIIFGLIIWLVVTIINRSKQQHILPKENKALEILKERYAKGEISKEEFEEKKKDLM